MTPIQYYKASLALPIVLPFLLHVGWALLNREGQWNHGTLAETSSFLLFSLLFGGLPYLVLVGGILWYFDPSDAAWYRRMSWWLPLIFGLFLGMCMFVLRFIEDRHFAWENALTFFLMGVTVGYPYVLLTHAGFYLLERLGLIQNLPA